MQNESLLYLCILVPTNDRGIGTDFRDYKISALIVKSSIKSQISSLAYCGISCPPSCWKSLAFAQSFRRSRPWLFQESEAP